MFVHFVRAIIIVLTANPRQFMYHERFETPNRWKKSVHHKMKLIAKIMGIEACYAFWELDRPNWIATHCTRSETKRDTETDRERLNVPILCSQVAKNPHMKINIVSLYVKNDFVPFSRIAYTLKTQPKSEYFVCNGKIKFHFIKIYTLDSAGTESA